jgi:peptidoglycan hydrolase CwlO-like protein
MEFLEDLGQKVGETVKVIGDKSQQVIEIGRINIEIGKEEASIKKLYAKVGEAVYRAHSKGDDTADIIDGLCQEIGERWNRIKELKDRIRELKSP